MPQSLQTAPTVQGHTGQRILLAQGDRTEEPAAEGTHAETKAEEPNPGEIPDAHLLLWNSALIAALLIAFALAARKTAKRPRGFANFAEWVAESLNNFTVGIIGHGGEQYTPLVGTVFLYILLMNLVGQIPILHSPTANLSITLALGVVVFIYVQFVGMKNSGVGGYLKHFAGPMLPMAPLMFPIEIISEIVKPFTLAIRLFGNIFGEHVIVGVLAGLFLSLGLPALGWLPTQFPIQLLGLLFAFVQAMVFAMLTGVYIVLMSHHDEHVEDHVEESLDDAASSMHGSAA